ncbi:sensor histidine kinase [Streptomyces camponoticapitis]|uniref:histidine kinase n=1 Tax=Streptomyces camponoticapitis TaxID=1616125 RepID=A0ABQ2E0S8_9ACTN|nr:ATP-binding protein [Streptomyces camponoticapitis]GGJ85383.1 sensor histidine kinase [Streptomyces camponoticapitis]
MIEITVPAAAGLSAGTLLALVLGGFLLRSRRDRSGLREEIACLRERLDDTRAKAARASDDLIAEIAHLTEKRIPAVATRAAHPHAQVPGPLSSDFARTRPGAGLEGVLDGLLGVMTKERKRVDAAARAGMRGTTREIQAGLYRLQDVLRGLQQQYDEPELAQTLFELDHENEQSLRRAQVAAVVCGAWVGLAREESHLVDAVTGGQSRLVGYHRVRVNNHLESGTALVSHAVEPVAIIVAELLDNALRHSSRDSDVTVNLERAHHGVAVTIDDAGVGMSADERAYAQRMVASSEPILLSDLGDPPRMGLAAIGQLTRQFDLSVDLSTPSPYGGVRAVLLVDNHLLSHVDPVVRPPAAAAPRSTREADTPEPPVRQETRGKLPVRTGGSARTRKVTGSPAFTAAEILTRTNFSRVEDSYPETVPDPGTAPDDDLPQRRRRHARPGAEAAVPAARPVPEQAPPPARTPEDSAAALGALQTGTAAARSSAEPEGNDPR